VTSIPTIELGRLDGSPADRARLARDVDEVAREVGFLYLSDHGVDDRLIADMWAVTNEFFDLPLEVKSKYVAEVLSSERGYTRFATEHHAHTLGATAPADLFEAFTMGNFDLEDDDYVNRATETFFWANIWPVEVAEMREVWERYHSTIGRVSHRLMSALALALDLPDDWFMPYVDRDVRTVRSLRYPSLVQAPEADQFGIAAHSDYGSITILNTNGISGLQVEREVGGDWIDVPHVDGAFIVNVGDIMSRWSNGRWRSTMHRVVRRPGEPMRQSIAHFCAPNYDAVVSALPNCVPAGEEPRFAPVVSGEWILAKLRSAYTEPLEVEPAR